MRLLHSPSCIMILMHYGKLFGWGVVIYALMFLLWSGFVTYGFIEGIVPRITGLLVLVGIMICAGLSLHFHRWHDILPYSFSWAFMLILLDGLFSVPYAGWQLYLDWNVWFGYAVVAVVPLFAPFFRFERFSGRLPARSEEQSSIS